MVSHCKTESRRKHFIAKLQTHLKTLSIDILGQCGKDVLPKYNFVGESLGKKSDLSNYISLSFDKTSNTIILIAIFYFPFQNRK